MPRAQKDPAVEEIANIIENSLARFSPEERERRLTRMEQIVFKTGRPSRGRSAKRARMRPSRPSARLRAKR